MVEVPEAERTWWQRKIDLYAGKVLQVLFWGGIIVYLSDKEPATIPATAIITIIAAAFYYYNDTKSDFFVLETRLNGDVVGYDEDGNEIKSDVTESVLWAVPESLYHSYTHAGERESFWHPGDRILFADYIDKKKHIIYHARHPDLENVNFYTRAKWWIQILKKEMPEAMEQNQTLKNLMEYLVNKKHHGYVLEYEGDKFLDPAQEIIAHRNDAGGKHE